MHSPCCPICEMPMPVHELERHANGHFEDDELARDFELAQQIALAPASPSHISNEFYMDRENPASSTSMNHGNSGSEVAKGYDEKIRYIISRQQRASFYKFEVGLMTMLKNCLESENATSILSGYVDHYQCIISEDLGWGCGWRNIQMVSSHLLSQRPEARDALFGGSGFVPDIGSLQRWLELAWERGFDITGSSHFNDKIYGSKKWIGTTECATLFRSFGLRARIVDFDSKDVMVNPGPMDKFVLKRKVEGLDCSENSGGCSSGKRKGYEVLIDWVWSYFSESNAASSNKRRVVVTDKMPLYFQHQGHSRTIVGIQVKHQPYGMKQYNLLVLDPGHSTDALRRSLEQNSGWQRFIKRGVHTLKKPQYQLCFVDPGVASGEELEQLKTIHGVLIEC